MLKVTQKLVVFNFLLLNLALNIQSQAVQECLLIANGHPLSKTLLETLVPNKTKIVLDGAALVLLNQYQSFFTPDLILGDFDSLPEFQKHLFEDIPLLHAPSQNFTDLEKGIHYCQRIQAPAIWIVNGLGLDRLDHTLANLYFLKKYYSPNVPVRLVSENEILEFVKDAKIQFQGKVGRAVGVFGFPKAYVTSQGLQYPMDRYEVILGKQLSSSNYIENESIQIQIDGEALVSYPHSLNP